MDKNKLIDNLKETVKILKEELDSNEGNGLNIDYRSFLTESIQTYLRDIKPLESGEEADDCEKKSLKLILSKSSGDTNKLDENKLHNFSRSHALLHLKSNAICTWIPKNACSNLRYSIAVANGAISGIGDINWIHKNNSTFVPSNIDLLRAEYSFVILRNPFKRLLSFYCDKLCNNAGKTGDESYQRAKSLIGTTADTTFSDFVDILWNNPSLKQKDQHIRDQCDFLAYKKYNDYFSLERYEEAITSIHKKTNLKIEDVRPFNSIHTTFNCHKSDAFNYNMPSKEIASLMSKLKKPVPENMYSKELIRKVGALYFNDILLYLKTIRDGEKELTHWMNHMM